MLLLTSRVVLLAIFLPSSLAYEHATCCHKAKADGAFLSSSPGLLNATCGQVFSTSLPAALPVYVDYRYCKANCAGIGLNKVSLPGSWAAPLVQFILPSIIFSMTIPRQKKISYDYLFDFPCNWTRFPQLNDLIALVVSLVCFLVILIPVVIDTMVWISVIVIGAGNMLIGGLYEAHLDYRLIKYIKKMGLNTDVDGLCIKRELLVTICSGNLMLSKGDPQTAIPLALVFSDAEGSTNGNEKSRSRLLNLLDAQTSFGSAVGSPVVFYLGAFSYSILDLFNDKSSEHAAMSLGFGIEWMIIVHVAIVSGCLLAANNPSTSAGIVGLPHKALQPYEIPLRRSLTLEHRLLEGYEVKRKWTWERFSRVILGWSNSYDTDFQPVSLWGRGANKMRWIEKTEAYKDKAFRYEMQITWLGWITKIYIPGLFLIVLPPATGGAVAYFTPPKGIACRSLGFIIYAVCQVVICTTALIHAAVDDGTSRPKGLIQTLFTGWRYKLILSPFWFGSLLSAVGGTTMQIVGVYNNCICYAGANSWFDVDRVNPPVNLATDTEQARNSSVYWIWMGSIAAVFMALNCYVGWWYQRLIRERFKGAVRDLYVPAERKRVSMSPWKREAKGKEKERESEVVMDPMEAAPSPALSPWSDIKRDDSSIMNPLLGEGGSMLNVSAVIDGESDGRTSDEGSMWLNPEIRRPARARPSFGEWEGLASSSQFNTVRNLNVNAGAVEDIGLKNVKRKSVSRGSS